MSRPQTQPCLPAAKGCALQLSWLFLPERNGGHRSLPGLTVLGIFLSLGSLSSCGAHFPCPGCCAALCGASGAAGLPNQGLQLIPHAPSLILSLPDVACTCAKAAGLTKSTVSVFLGLVRIQCPRATECVTGAHPPAHPLGFLDLVRKAVG